LGERNEHPIIGQPISCRAVQRQFVLTLQLNERLVWTGANVKLNGRFWFLSPARLMLGNGDE